MPGSYCSLVDTIKQKTKSRFGKVTMVGFHMLRKYDLNKSSVSFKDLLPHKILVAYSVTLVLHAPEELAQM